jgi:hypothetical protein
MRSRYLLLAWPLLAGLAPPATQAAVDISVGISVPGVQIGIHVPAYPELQPVPDYPVYYAPGLPANYFFYDGLYWVYANDTWYSSSWYNGPWYRVEPAVVPVFVLRVPVRYYRVPPPYFRGWAPAEPPRWGSHWGPQWEAQHRGWNQWDRRAAPPPAPLPAYQRQYVGDRYPAREQQHAIREQRYHFEPRDAQVRERLAAEAHPDTERDRRGAVPRQRPQAQPRGQQERQPAQERQAREREQPAQPRQQPQPQARQTPQPREQQEQRQQQAMQERQPQQAREQQRAERHDAERPRAQKQPHPPERSEPPRESSNGG